MSLLAFSARDATHMNKKARHPSPFACFIDPRRVHAVHHTTTTQQRSCWITNNRKKKTIYRIESVEKEKVDDFHHPEETMPMFASSSLQSSTSTTSSTSNRSETKEIETREIPIPLWALLIGIALLVGTLTIVYRCDNFTVYEYEFTGSFCIFYTTLWIATVVCCCADADPPTKKKIKTVEGRQRRSRWV